MTSKQFELCQFHFTKYSEREGGNLPNKICDRQATKNIGFIQDMKSLALCEEHYQLLCQKIDEMMDNDNNIRNQ